MPPAPTMPTTADFAEVDVDPVERETDQARHDLRLDGVIDHLRPARARCADRFNLRRVDLLDVFGQQLGEEADSGERQRQKSRERPEAEYRDEEDRDDDLLDCPAKRDDRAATE